MKVKQVTIKSRYLAIKFFFESRYRHDKRAALWQPRAATSSTWLRTLHALSFRLNVEHHIALWYQGIKELIPSFITFNSCHETPQHTGVAYRGLLVSLLALPAMTVDHSSRIPSYNR
jgi:hypothetical protein